jgi:hypothetical protein
MAAPERFAKTSDSSLAPRAPSIHGTQEASQIRSLMSADWGAPDSNADAVFKPSNPNGPFGLKKHQAIRRGQNDATPASLVRWHSRSQAISAKANAFFSETSSPVRLKCSPTNWYGVAPLAEERDYYRRSRTWKKRCRRSLKVMIARTNHERRGRPPSRPNHESNDGTSSSGRTSHSEQSPP